MNILSVNNIHNCERLFYSLPKIVDLRPTSYCTSMSIGNGTTNQLDVYGSTPDSENNFQAFSRDLKKNIAKELSALYTKLVFNGKLLDDE